jgi:putative acetyltransferase
MTSSAADSSPSDSPKFRVRPRAEGDVDAIVDVWVASWQETLPQIDFSVRRDWLITHIGQLESSAAVTICAIDPANKMVGFVIVEPATGWLDQIAVAPTAKGTGAAKLLLEEARRLSPQCLALDVNVENPRARRFYEKEGFVTIGEGVNPMSGLKTLRLLWTGTAPDSTTA